MAYTAKVLADGQLPSTKGTLYTVPGATTAYVRQIRVFSTGAGQTIVVYIKPGSTSRRIAQFVLGTNEYADVLTEPILLTAASAIEGQATNASIVDYVITGVEQA